MLIVQCRNRQAQRARASQSTRNVTTTTRTRMACWRGMKQRNKVSKVSRPKAYELSSYSLLMMSRRVMFSSLRGRRCELLDCFGVCLCATARKPKLVNISRSVIACGVTHTLTQTQTQAARHIAHIRQKHVSRHDVQT